jgi:hypothetical protein
MSPQLPSFLRRRMRLSEARRLLLAGEAEAALECLRDPCLEGASELENLQERVLDALCRLAGQKVEEGQFDESERLLLLVAPHDSKRARAWRKRLATEAHGSQVSHMSGVRRGAESGMIQAMQNLLGELRDKGSRAGSQVLGAAQGSGDRRTKAGPTLDRGDVRDEGVVQGQRTFLFAVDDIGEFLVAIGGEVTLGHARSELADLPMLADLDAIQSTFVRTESFHSGPGWRIEASRGQNIAIGGELIDPGGASLADGDVVQVSPNVAFLFRRPEPGSGSAVLELLHGVECCGASRILLFAPTRAGRVRIGNRGGRHLVARRVEEDIILWIDGGELVVETDGKLRADGVYAAIQTSTEAGPGGLRVPCPPRRRVDFSVGTGGKDGPPFGFAIRPRSGKNG